MSLADNLSNAVVGAEVSIELSKDTSGGSWFGTAPTGAKGSVTFRLRNTPAELYTTQVTGMDAGDLTCDGATTPRSIKHSATITGEIVGHFRPSKPN